MALEKLDSYEEDFYAWANEQAGLLRAKKFEQLDLEHIAEEIESMGKSEKRELLHRLAVLLCHLLKWTFQPNLRSRSWEVTIEGQRFELELHLKDNPSLKSKLPDVFLDAFRLAKIEAMKETGLPKTTFPSESPWSFEEIMDNDFWPE
jgi:Domain of unknown function DUF29